MHKEFLPTWLREPLRAAVIARWEAAALFQHYLATLHGARRPLPKELWSAAQRVQLWQQPTPATLH